MFSPRSGARRRTWGGVFDQFLGPRVISSSLPSVAVDLGCGLGTEASFPAGWTAIHLLTRGRADATCGRWAQRVPLFRVAGLASGNRAQSLVLQDASATGAPF